MFSLDYHFHCTQCWRLRMVESSNGKSTLHHFILHDEILDWLKSLNIEHCIDGWAGIIHFKREEDLILFYLTWKNYSNENNN